MELESYFEDFNHRDWQQTESGTVRFALIGLGWWTIDWAIPSIEDSDLCETTVLVSSSTEKAERVAENHDVERGISYDEFHDGVASEEYDAIYICTPNALHVQYAETAAELGKDVLCEKPMEATVERAEELVAPFEESESRLMIGYRMHTEPGVRRARELVQEGFIGEPIQVHGHNSQRILEINPDTDQWRLSTDLSGYGTSVMDIGIYPLNTARFILGSDPVTVQAMMDSRNEAFSDVPDEYAAFTMAFDDGTQAVCTASQNGYESTNLRITGTEGEINLEPAFHMETEITVSREGATAQMATEDVNQMEEIFDYFADRILSDSEIYADGEHGLVDMKAMERIYEAGETSETLDVF